MKRGGWTWRRALPFAGWLAVLVALAAMWSSRDATAQHRGGRREGHHLRLRVHADGGLPEGESEGEREADVDAAVVAPANPAVGPSDAGVAGDAGAPRPIDYAVLVDGGGVPIHTEGLFRSPFAHPRFGRAVPVRVGLMLVNVRDFDIQKGTFHADFFLSLTSRRPMPALDLLLTNGNAEVRETIADTPTFKLYRFIGDFDTDVDIHDYPFDTQALSVEVEDDDSGIDQLILVADREHTALDVGFRVPGWETSFIEAHNLTHYYPDRFEGDDLYYSRYVFRLGIRRYSTSAVFTVFFPAVVIVLISFLGLWLPREELDVRSNSTTPMLPAAVLFHYALIQSLPATGYLTRADKLMMAVYTCLGMHMAISWLWFALPPRHAERVHRWGLFIGAPLTVALMVLGIRS